MPEKSAFGNMCDMPQDEGGLGVVLGRGRRERDRPKFDRAMVGILAGNHVDRMIAILAEIAESGARDGDRVRAATALIELALERDVTVGSLGNDVTRIYVLAEAPGAIAAAVDEARRRRALPVGGK